MLFRDQNNYANAPTTNKLKVSRGFKLNNIKGYEQAIETFWLSYQITFFLK